MSGDGTRAACPLCALPVAAGVVVDVAGEAMTTSYADEELVALVDPGSPGVLLVPRSHVGGLGAMPGLAGVFLGALRRAVTAVQAAYGALGAMIEPSTSLGGACGHVAYRVVPTMPPEGGGHHAAPATAVVSENLAEALGSRLAPR
ncbi:MAG: hypothetical protein ACRDZR_16675 [Acidimicrobiales bacterium]